MSEGWVGEWQGLAVDRWMGDMVVDHFLSTRSNNNVCHFVADLNSNLVKHILSQGSLSIRDEGRPFS